MLFFYLDLFKDRYRIERLQISKQSNKIAGSNEVFVDKNDLLIAFLH
jgi:hypothetical protein